MIAGPTGVGKTALSLCIAGRLGAEIISADSRQVYRGLEIGVSKPPAEALKSIRHHFISERELDCPWSAGKFSEEANGRIAELLNRGAVPLVVGGSTLYLDALVHGLADLPESDLAIRAGLNDEASTNEGAQALFAELQRADPKGAATLDWTKKQRLVRALEVYRTTGKPWSSFFAKLEPPPYQYRVVVLTRPRKELYARIEARVDAMLHSGLLDENRRLLERGFRLNRNPLRTIGYQEPFDHLSGEIDYNEMVRLLKRNSRRYAKRQLTWFGHRAEYEWVDLSAFDSTEGAANAILEAWPTHS